LSDLSDDGVIGPTAIDPKRDVSMIRMSGKVTSGLGRGQYFVSKEGYRTQFNLLLGFDPAPGTLNLKLEKTFFSDNVSSIKIEGFVDEGSTFGECICHIVKINKIMGAIIRPKLSSYPPNLVEIIAPVNLRKTLNIKDNDEVELILE
jgi:riboflavin kinase